MMIPAKFTYVEGGEWAPWPARAGEPPISFYSKRDHRGVVHFWSDKDGFGLWTVHSLITPQGYRWDCINGWTGRIEGQHSGL